MAFYNGFAGSVRINEDDPVAAQFTLHAKEWGIRTFSDDVDVTHAVARTDAVNKGFVRISTSLRGAEGTVRAVWCSEDDPFRNPPQLIPNTVCSLSLHIHKTERKYFWIRWARIITVDMQLTVRGLAEYGISFKSDGYFSYPKHL